MFVETNYGNFKLSVELYLTTVNTVIQNSVQNVSVFSLVYVHLLWKQHELNCIKAIFIVNFYIHTGVQ